MICGSGGSKSIGSLKRRVRRHLIRWEMKNCTPLWREAHCEVKMYKTHQVRNTFGSWDVKKSACCCGAKHISTSKVWKSFRSWNTFGSWDVEKVQAVVARSTSPSQNVQNTTRSEHFWKLRCWKTARCCDAKHISKSNCWKHHMLGPLLKVQMWFGVAGARDSFCTLPKVSKTWSFRSSSKNNGRRGTFAADLQRCISRGRRSTRDIFIRDVRRSGWRFPGRGCILEHQIFRFAEMILRDRCSTSCDLASLFRGRRNTCSALNVPFLRENLAELLRFWSCQLGKLMKSRRIALFLTLSTSQIEKVSQNSCVFDVLKFKNWGRLAE